MLTTHLIPKVDPPKIETRVKKVDPPGSTSWDFTEFSEIGEVLKMMRISNESVIMIRTRYELSLWCRTKSNIIYCLLDVIPWVIPFKKVIFDFGVRD